MDEYIGLVLSMESRKYFLNEKGNFYDIAQTSSIAHHQGANVKFFDQFICFKHNFLQFAINELSYSQYAFKILIHFNIEKLSIFLVQTNTYLVCFIQNIYFWFILTRRVLPIALAQTSLINFIIFLTSELF